MVEVGRDLQEGSLSGQRVPVLCHHAAKKCFPTVSCSTSATLTAPSCSGSTDLLLARGGVQTQHPAPASSRRASQSPAGFTTATLRLSGY